MSRKRVQEKKKFSGKKKFVKGRAVKQKAVKPKKREIREWEKQGLIREESIRILVFMIVQMNC